MASVLATLAALAVIGLLFALDPGGAIAESGFPDYREMDWKQLTAWGFRTIGVGVGLLLVLGLWLRYPPKQEIKHRDPLELGRTGVRWVLDVGGPAARHRGVGRGGPGRHQPGFTGRRPVSGGLSGYPATRAAGRGA